MFSSKLFMGIEPLNFLRQSEIHPDVFMYNIKNFELSQVKIY